MDELREIQALRERLTRAGYEYYVLDRPTMSDYDYDHQLRRLEELEAAHPEVVTPDSPTQRVGGQALDSFTLAQITGFLDLAIQQQRTNCTAALLEYKNARLSDFNPMDVFTLDRNRMFQIKKPDSPAAFGFFTGRRGFRPDRLPRTRKRRRYVS